MYQSSTHHHTAVETHRRRRPQRQPFRPPRLALLHMAEAQIDGSAGLPLRQGPPRHHQVFRARHRFVGSPCRSSSYTAALIPQAAPSHPIRGGGLTTSVHKDAALRNPTRKTRMLWHRRPAAVRSAVGGLPGRPPGFGLVSVTAPTWQLLVRLFPAPQHLSCPRYGVRTPCHVSPCRRYGSACPPKPSCGPPARPNTEQAAPPGARHSTHSYVLCVLCLACLVACLVAGNV